MKWAMVIRSGGVLLGPVHQAIPLAGSSTCRIHESKDMRLE